MHRVPRRTIARTTAAVVALLVTGAAAGACSSDGGTDATTTTAAGATTAPGATGTSMAGSTTTVAGTTATTGIGGPTVPTSAGSATTAPDEVPADVQYPASGVACVSGGAAGTPVMISISGSLAGGAPDGTMTIRILDGEDFADLTGEIRGGAFTVSGSPGTTGDKDVVEAFIVTPGGETIDVTIAVQDHFGSVLDVSGAGAVAGTGNCPG